MARHPLRMQAARVADVPSTIGRGIGIEQLPIVSITRRPNSIVIAGDGGEIAHAEDLLVGIGGFPQKGNDGIGGVVKVHPLEAGPVVIDFMKCRLCSIQTIEIPHETLDSSMKGVEEKMPVQASIVIPFLPLAEFATHEEHFLSRMTVHESVERA